MKLLREWWIILKEAAIQWYNGNTFLHGAALAYYTVFSLAPTLIIALGIAGLVFQRDAAQKQMISQINETFGDSVGKATNDLLQYAGSPGHGLIATILSLVVLILSATSLFGQLQSSLDTIWGVEAKPGRGILGVLKDRLLSFAVVVGIGFLLLVSLVVSAGLAAIGKLLTPESLPGGTYLWQGINVLISFGLITLLFALIFKVLPDVRIAWREVWVGAVVTALLFTIGKYLLGLYLGRTAVVSPYGAAGSLVLILLWVYYSSQILLFGAEITQAYARHHGNPLEPTENAIRINRTTEDQRTTRMPHGQAVGAAS